jgi:hypothetical protein
LSVRRDSHSRRIASGTSRYIIRTTSYSRSMMSVSSPTAFTRALRSRQTASTISFITTRRASYTHRLARSTAATATDTSRSLQTTSHASLLLIIISMFRSFQPTSLTPITRTLHSRWLGRRIAKFPDLLHPHVTAAFTRAQTSLSLATLHLVPYTMSGSAATTYAALALLTSISSTRPMGNVSAAPCSGSRHVVGAMRTLEVEEESV